MLSGIGPAAHLKEIGIAPVLDLPVGKNLQDHPAALIMYSRANAGPFRDAMRFDRMAFGMVSAHFFGTGRRNGRAGRAARLHQDAAGACRP